MVSISAIRASLMTILWTLMRMEIQETYCKTDKFKMMSLLFDFTAPLIDNTYPYVVVPDETAKAMKVEKNF